MKKNNFIHNLSVMITTKCTLKCKYCSAQIPKFTPIDMPLRKVFQLLDKAFEIYDYIEDFRIMGGEAFLHPDISEILLYTSKYQANFRKLLITTNGTYLLNPLIIELLKASPYEYSIIVDDYGKYSHKFSKLISLLDDNNINYQIHYYNDKEQYCGGWVDLSLSDTLVNGSLEKRFERCHYRKNCTIIWDDKLWRCSTNAAAELLGLVPLSEKDFVDLFSGSSIEEIRKEIARLGKHPFETCKYCNGFDPESSQRIPAAEQA